MTSDYFTILSIIISIVATLVVIMAFVEWRKLSQLRKDIEESFKQYQSEINNSTNATHKMLASYQIANVKEKISLLEQAITLQPDVFNGYNALGYAYIENKNYAGAIVAFTQAIVNNPKNPAGYCDLAHAYCLCGNKEFCKQKLEKAIALDPQQKEIIRNDMRFQGILEE